MYLGSPASKDVDWTDSYGVTGGWERLHADCGTCKYNISGFCLKFKSWIPLLEFYTDSEETLLQWTVDHTPRKHARVHWQVCPAGRLWVQKLLQPKVYLPFFFCLKLKKQQENLIGEEIRLPAERETRPGMGF